ncbi:class I SAM-dependent methyltransferase [Halostreptopolyspora alba]|uniref:Class I SAM-dependent methyltransferase n=1 Tax=Halostreptopolyspora alba TaxID=2487137 RepID=A0A3N0E5B1_9ACTN|nr:class I SAM-dependent methyltransferase [Nocardiopsaceae bacterium YIM 96095]
MSAPLGCSVADAAHRAGLRAAGNVDRSLSPELVRRLDLAVLRGIGALLQPVIGADPPRAWTGDEVADAFAAAPRHRWILGHWMAALATEGLARRDGEAYRAGPRIRRRDLAAARRDIRDAPAKLGFPPELGDYLTRTLGELPRLLRDEVSAQALLFPGADLATAEAVYHRNPVSRYLNAAAATSVRAVLPAGTGRTRVLELGAGIGATTADLLPVLAGRDTDYLYTDLSPFFLDMARERFAAHPFLRFGVLDFVTDLPGLAGQDPFDLVVAANTAHNAPHVPRLLARIGDLLTPDGVLLLVETCHEHHQSLTSMPFLLSGGAAPRDTRRGSRRTYLTREEWVAALRDAGMRVRVDLPPPGDPMGALSQRVILASR